MTDSANLPRRRLLQAAAWAALSGATTGAAWAQHTWPTRPVRLVVPYPAGGVNDVIARQFGELLAGPLGQALVVENRGGAGGTIGMTEVARSAGDGYTFAFGAISPLTLNPHIMKVGYAPMQDLVPVAAVMYAPVLVLATQAFAGKDFAAVLAAAKSQPKGVTVATSGYGTLAHIMIEQLRRKSGANLVHVPYKGGSQLITDAAGAQFDLLLANPFGPINALIAEGKLRVLAVTGPARLPAFAQQPTLGELGFAEANLTSTFGFYAPASTPADIQQRFHNEVNRILATPQMQERLLKLDNQPYVMSQEAFVQLVRQDHDNNARIVREADIKAQ